jgi:hypothetical protein
MNRTLFFHLKSKARRFIMTATVEVKRNYFIMESHFLKLSHTDAKGNICYNPFYDPSDPQIRMQIHTFNTIYKTYPLRFDNCIFTQLFLTQGFIILKEGENTHFCHLPVCVRKLACLTIYTSNKTYYMQECRLEIYRLLRQAYKIVRTQKKNDWIMAV